MPIQPIQDTKKLSDWKWQEKRCIPVNVALITRGGKATTQGWSHLSRVSESDSQKGLKQVHQDVILVVILNSWIQAIIFRNTHKLKIFKDWLVDQSTYINCHNRNVNIRFNQEGSNCKHIKTLVPISVICTLNSMYMSRALLHRNTKLLTLKHGN